MAPEEVDKEFLKAFEKLNSTSKKFPPDIMLKFYAYYKQATEQEAKSIPVFQNPDEEYKDIKSAFKLNALLQIKGISSFEAKLKYIELVKENLED